MIHINHQCHGHAAPGATASVPAHLRGLVANAPRPKLLLGLALALGLLLGTDSAYAGWGWGAWVAAVALAAIAAVALAPVLIASVVIAALVVKVAVMVFLVAALAWSIAIGQGEVYTQPIEAAAPQPPDPTPVSLNLTPIPLPGNAADALVTTVNGAIAAATTLSDNASQSRDVFQQDLAALRDALAPAGADLNSLLASQSLSVPNISQTDITNLMADITRSGLPLLAIDAMRDAGLNPTEIQRLTTNFLTPDIRLAVPSVSISQVFDIVAALQVVPEPAGHGLVSIGLLAALVAGVRRRTLSPPSPAPSPSCP